MRGMMPSARNVLFCALLAWSTPAGAEPCETASPVVRGTPAACDGVILPHTWARAGLECLEVDVPACRARLELLQEVRSSCEKTLANTVKQCERTGLAYEDAIRRAAHLEDTWWRSPVIWAFLAGTAGLGIGLAAGISF